MTALLLSKLCFSWHVISPAYRKDSAPAPRLGSHIHRTGTTCLSRLPQAR